MKSKRIISICLALSICCMIVITGCTTTKDNNNTQTQTSKDDDTKAKISPTDYSQSDHWLNLPTEPTKEVDVFYLYPSSWAKVNADDPIICEIDNPVMLKYSKMAYDRQATAFETIANIYAPYYRQDDAGSTLQMSVEEQQEVVKGVPLTDATAAFEYYIEHYNNGRPFILAGHSQGSNVMIYILQDYMKEHPDVYKRMIAAYVIGYSITDDYLAKNPHLKFATGAKDTGVIISYNTQAPTIEGTNGVVLPTAHVINPISWTTDETVASASDNLGSLQLNSDGSVVTNPDGTYVKVMNFADARVDKTNGVIICSTVDVDKYAPGGALFGKGIFHSFDYPFYYYNLQANAQERVANYLKENK
ncbi:MAG: DUF3089 domain-containing protein [Clostridia bacterium]|nr:DUF3089 domain-containing protein [Clostridia bacterium]